MSLKKFRKSGLVFSCLALCLAVLAASSSWAASSNPAADALLDALDDTNVSSHTLSGTLNVRRTEDGDYLDFLSDPLYRTFTISSSGSTTTLGYSSSSSNTAEDDGVEFCFLIAPGGELVFDKAANLSGGYSDSGLFYVEDGKLTFKGDTTLSGNKSYDAGGAINIRKFSGAATLTFSGNAVFSSNEAENSGGALAMMGATANFAKNATFSSNTSSSGGALDLASDSILSITGTTSFSSNKATDGSGGAVSAIGGTMTFGSTLTVEKNTATENGGGLYLEGVAMTVAGVATFTANQAEYGEDSSAAGGGAIAAAGGTIHFKNTATFGGNTASLGNSAKTSGGAVYLDGGARLTFDKTATFQYNKTTDSDGGALYVNDGTVTFGADSSFLNSSAGGSGGALYLYGSATFTGAADFKNNSAAYGDGGAFYLTGAGVVSFDSDTVFQGNTATAGMSGGGAMYVDSESSVTFKTGTTTTFEKNKTLAGSDNGTPGGGAVFLYGVGSPYDPIAYGWNANGTMKFLDNEAVGQGGAMALESSAAQFAAVTLTGNAAKYTNADESDHGGGGAIYAYDSLVVFNESVTMSTNKAANGSGGGIFATSTGTVDVDNPVYGIRFTKGGTISGNTAKEGGAFYLDMSAISFAGTTTISANKATGGNGGAFFLDGSMISFAGTTTISANEASAAGGGFYVTGTSMLRFEEGSTTTLSGNTAASGKGGAIHVEESSELTLDLKKNATLNLSAGTGNNVVFNDATLNVNTATNSALNIATGFTGNENSDFRVTGPGNVSLTGTISYIGATVIDDGGVLSIGGTSTFGVSNFTTDSYENSNLVIGENGAGTLIFSITESNKNARLSVNTLKIGEQGEILISLPSDDSGSADGKFALIKVYNDGTYFDWSDYTDRIGSSIGFLKITEFDYQTDPDEYDPDTANLLSVKVEFDDTAPWTFNLASDFTLRKTVLNDSTKALTVNGAGRLFLANDANVGALEGSGNIVLNDNVTSPTKGAALTVNQASTYSGTISGLGALVKKGTGVLELTGKNSYEGGTTVSGGTLKGNTDSLQKNISIASGASVEFHQTTDGTFSGKLTGDGGVVVNNEMKIDDKGIQSDQSLTFDSANDYKGDTTIKSGWLLLGSAGSLSNSNIFVQQDGGLGGSGTIAKTVNVASGGVVQAYGGNLKIQGDLVFSNGSYLYVIANGDDTDVVSVGGTAYIDGATVKVVGVGESFVVNEAFTFIEGTTDGDFANSESTYSNYKFTWTKSADGKSYTMTGIDSDDPPVPPVASGLTSNQTQTKFALDTIYAMGSGTALYDTIRVLNSLNPSDPEKNGYSPIYLDALDQLSGASRANSMKMGMFSPAATMFRHLSMGPTAYGGIPYNNGYGPLDEYGMRGEATTIRGQDEFCNPHGNLCGDSYGELYDSCSASCYSAGNNFWFDVVHVQTNADSDGNSGNFGVSRTGFFIGYDALRTSNTKVGLTFGFFAPYVWQRNDRYDADDYHLGLLVQRQYMGAEFLGYLGYAHQEYKSSRNVSLLDGYSEHLTGKTSGDSFYASLELAKPRWTTSGIVVRPLFGVDYLLTAQKGYGETGGIYALDFDRATYEQLFLRIGVHFKKETFRSTGVLRLQYIYEALGNNAPESAARFASVGGSPVMTIRGVDPGRDYFNVGTGVNLLLNSPRTRRLGLDYNFNVAKHLTEHSIGLFYTESF